MDYLARTKDYDFVFFDFEVFDNLWLVCLMHEGQETTIVNDRTELYKFFKKHDKSLWIGYNNKNYDNHILKAILEDLPVKQVNDIIIYKLEDEESKGLLSKIWKSKFKFNSYDASVWKGLQPIGLKKILGDNGLNIKEFKHREYLEEDDLQECIEYCKNDVRHLPFIVDVVKKQEIEVKVDIIKQNDLSFWEINKSYAYLTSKILIAAKTSRMKSFVFTKWLSQLDIKEQKIHNFYKGKLNFKDHLKIPNPKHLTFKYGMDEEKAKAKALETGRDYQDYFASGYYRFGFGGLHLDVKCKYEEDSVYTYMDVSSYYPSIMILFSLLSRNCPESGRLRFHDFFNVRMRNKEKGKLTEEEKAIDNINKVVLNTAFGAMDNQYNSLYDPEHAKAVPILGQLILWDLIEKVTESGGDVIYTNTDALVVKHTPFLTDKISNIINEWKDRFGLRIVKKKIKNFVIKDTSNRIFVFEDGEVEYKGAYVNNANLLLENKKVLDNNMIVVSNAVLNYFLNGVPTAKTIEENNNPLDYQIIKNVGKNYDEVFWKIGEVNIPINNRTNRVFASKNKLHGKIYKKKQGKNPEQIGDTPAHCLVNNQGLPTMESIDKDWYKIIARNRVVSFK